MLKENIFNENIAEAILEFQRKVYDEPDYTKVAIAIHYLLISIYISTNTPDWKNLIKKNMDEILVQFED